MKLLCKDQKIFLKLVSAMQATIFHEKIYSQKMFLNRFNQFLPIEISSRIKFDMFCSRVVRYQNCSRKVLGQIAAYLTKVLSTMLVKENADWLPLDDW